jgi:hypothetical protein
MSEKNAFIIKMCHAISCAVNFYNAGVVNFYNATGSLARFENKKYFITL